MEEVDSILIYTLKRIGCDVGAKIVELSPVQLIKCVSRCIGLIRPESEIPAYDGNISMSSRYKVASQIAQLITDMGYKEEIGCQSFLYPAEADTRKLLLFLVEKLPRDDSELGDKIETLLSKFSQENEENNKEVYSGIEVDGIRLPAAVDVNSLPKETLKFYASHLADITFAKQREKFKKTVDAPVTKDVVTPTKEKYDSDDDFGDPDEPIEQEAVPVNTESVKPKQKPQIAEKPKLKPPISEKPKIDTDEKERLDIEAEKKRLEELAAEEAAAKIKAMQDETKAKALALKEKEKSMKEMNERISSLENQLSTLKEELERKEKDLDRQMKTQQLLEGSEDGLEKVKKAVEAQVEKILNLSNQWESHRQPLLDEIRTKRFNSANKLSETAKQLEQIRSLKATLKDMGQEAKAKTEAYTHLVAEYEKMPKDLNRSAYTRRICEIIGNIKKQKREITKVLKDTKDIQKNINTLTGRLDRTFAVADELIFKDAEKDKNVAQSYKLLVAIHSDFSRIIKTLEETGNLQRQGRDLEDKLELEKGKIVEDKLKRLKADLTQLRNENKILDAKLRDPTVQMKRE